MPDKRKRFRTKKLDDSKQPTNGHIILAKRGDDQQRQPLVQPKILLKTRVRDNQENNSNNKDTIKTIIIHRSNDSSGTSIGFGSSGSGGTAHNSQSSTTLLSYSQQYKQPASGSTLPSTGGYVVSQQRYSERQADDLCSSSLSAHTTNASGATHDSSEEGTAQQMVRPASIVSSSGKLYFNGRRFLSKTNTDFLVVGVIGAQGVGKTTVLNLLARDHLRITDPAEAYKRIFVDGDNIFSTKIKYAIRARTEATQMYITDERMILIDTPPLLHNTQQRDIAANELDELHNLINLLSSCHLLIIVYNEYLDINLVRLLRLAILVKPQQLTKACTPAYLPNIMFIKNRANRIDFEPASTQRMQTILKAMFADTGLHIYCGSKQAVSEPSPHLSIPVKAELKDETKAVMLEHPVGQEQPEQLDKAPSEHATTSIDQPKRLAPLNFMLLPHFESGDATTFHADLRALVTKLRERVLAAPRNKIFESSEFTEMDWFETIAKTVQEGLQHFEPTYKEVMLNHLDLESSGSGSVGASIPANAGGIGAAAGSGGGGSGGNNKARERNRDRKAFRMAVKPFD